MLVHELSMSAGAVVKARYVDRSLSSLDRITIQPLKFTPTTFVSLMHAIPSLL